MAWNQELETAGSLEEALQKTIVQLLLNGPLLLSACLKACTSAGFEAEDARKYIDQMAKKSWIVFNCSCGVVALHLVDGVPREQMHQKALFGRTGGGVHVG